MCPVHRWRVCSRWRGAACGAFRELDAGPLSGPPDDLPHRVGGERRLALAGLGGLTLTSILGPLWFFQLEFCKSNARARGTGTRDMCKYLTHKGFRQFVAGADLICPLLSPTMVRGGLW